MPVLSKAWMARSNPAPRELIARATAGSTEPQMAPMAITMMKRKHETTMSTTSRMIDTQSSAAAATAKEPRIVARSVRKRQEKQRGAQCRKQQRHQQHTQRQRQRKQQTHPPAQPEAFVLSGSVGSFGWHAAIFPLGPHK